MLTLETERLILRPFTMDDAEALHREIYSDPEVVLYYNGGRVFTLKGVREFLPKRLNPHQLGYWAVTLKENGQLLGQVHLDAYVNAGWYEMPDDDPLQPIQSLEVHLGFAFGKRFWGNGYAVEACRPVIRYAFTHLRLRRLLGGADIKNTNSIRLHERLGFRLFPSSDGTSITALLDNPLAAYKFRAYREEDRVAVSALGTHVIDWWHAKGSEASLHLVAVHTETQEVVGQLQAVDYSVPAPSRRPGQCHFVLEVAPEHRRYGIGSTLYAQAEVFGRRRGANLLYAAYLETEDAPAASFLQKRGFEPLERFYPSVLNLANWDPMQFQGAVDHVQSQGIQLVTFAELDDKLANRHLANRRYLYELEQLARTTQPFREVEPYVPERYGAWEEEFLKRDFTTIFLAITNAGKWVGVVTSLEWYFTGVHPDWRGRGIATALKVQCLTEAKRRGIAQMETENHGDNEAMLAVNRKLGFVFTAPEVACIKRFIMDCVEVLL